MSRRPLSALLDPPEPRPTHEQLRAGIDALLALAEAVRALGSVPSGVRGKAVQRPGRTLNQRRISRPQTGQTGTALRRSRAWNSMTWPAAWMRS